MRFVVWETNAGTESEVSFTVGPGRSLLQHKMRRGSESKALIQQHQQPMTNVQIAKVAAINGKPRSSQVQRYLSRECEST